MGNKLKEKVQEESGWYTVVFLSYLLCLTLGWMGYHGDALSTKLGFWVGCVGQLILSLVIVIKLDMETIKSKEELEKKYKGTIDELKKKNQEYAKKIIEYKEDLRAVGGMNKVYSSVIKGKNIELEDSKKQLEILKEQEKDYFED